MISAKGQVWLGFTRMGARFGLRPDDLGGGIAMLGQGANKLAPLVAYACHEAGLKVLVLDMEGSVADGLSGHMDHYDVSYFLYDSLKIEDDPVVHAQLIAGAYSTSLDLSFEQEAGLNAIAQIIANERGVASPSSLADLIQSPEVAKQRTVDRLRQRLETLRSFPLVPEKDAAKQVIQKSAVLSFRNAGSPEARETAVALFLAKLLAITGGGLGLPGPDVVVLTEANRLFKERPVFRKSQRFLASFVSAPLPKVLASDEAYALDKDYLDTCSVRILSSAVWNESKREGLVLTPNMFVFQNEIRNGRAGEVSRLVLTPNMFVFQNPSYGASEIFIPREFEGRRGQVKSGALLAPSADETLTRRILEEISAYEGATRASLVAFLASEFDKDLVESTLDRLQTEGYVATRQQERAGRMMHGLYLSDKGKAFLGRREN